MLDATPSQEEHAFEFESYTSQKKLLSHPVNPWINHLPNFLPEGWLKCHHLQLTLLLNFPFPEEFQKQSKKQDKILPECPRKISLINYC